MKTYVARSALLLFPLMLGAQQALATTCQLSGQHSLYLPGQDQTLLSHLEQLATSDHAADLVNYAQHSDSLNRPILGNYARLRLAALALRDGDTRFAREQLSQIEQNSPKRAHQYGHYFPWFSSRIKAIS